MNKLVSACLIVKGDKSEAEYLDQALASLNGNVDEICVTITYLPGEKRNYHVEKVAKKYKAIISDFEWIDDFAAARNYNMAQASSPWVIWIDADDTLEHGENLRDLLLNTPAHYSVLYTNYDYQIDDDGTVRTKHWRDRIFRNDGSVTWKGRLHETPVEVRRIGKAQIPQDQLNVKHGAKPERWDESEKRNIRILEKQLQDEHDSPDPRTLFYLGSAYKGQGRLNEAKELIELYLKLSGWDEERAIACIQLAEIYEAFDRETDAVDMYLQAIKEREDFPTGYVSLGMYYAHKQKFEKAIHWLEMAFAKGEPKTSMVLNPLDYTYKPLLVYAECMFSLGKFDKAIEAVEEARRYLADDLTAQLLTEYKRVRGHKQAVDAVLTVARFLENAKEADKVEYLLQAVPDQLRDNPLIIKMTRHYTPPKTWRKKSVAIFTGNNAIGEWGPWSLDEGIGGSEEAVIRMSRHLTELGYEVHVYANPGARAGLYRVKDGEKITSYASFGEYTEELRTGNNRVVEEDRFVTWHNYWELDLRDTFDIFIAWRSPWFFDAKVNARKKYLWLHDVMPVGEFTPERLANLDKVIVLSKYHRSLFPNIPDDKIMLSANGVDVEEFDGITVERDPHLVIYQSSHPRGLDHLYDIWPEVKQAVPDAKLHQMYGWDSYVAINRDNPERMRWMEDMIARQKALPDVYELGKVGHAKVVQEALSAGVWAYPTNFPEISCITAQKSQIGGAVPVCSNFAALDETVQFGVKLDLGDDWEKSRDAYRDALIDMLKDTDKQERIRKEMMPKAREMFSWRKVAEQWVEEFEV